MNDQSRVHPEVRMAAGGRAGGYQSSLLIFLLILLVNAVVLTAGYAGYDVALSKEHSALEFAQLIALLPAFALFWLGWRYGHEAEKTASGALAMLTAAMFVRELDVKTLGGPEWFRWLSHHGLQEILLVRWCRFSGIWHAVGTWQGLMRLSSPRPPYHCSSPAFCCLSPFSSIARSPRMLITVLGRGDRLNGYLFLTLSAWNHWSIVRRRLDGSQMGCP